MSRLDYYPDVREAEEAYDASLNDNHDVGKAVYLRNVGWDLVRGGETEDGFMNLIGSQRILTDSVEWWNSINVRDGIQSSYPFQREQYATLARTAQAYCAIGRLEDAVQYAHNALDLKPKEHERFSEWDGRARSNVDRRVFPDQYEIIFTSRLAMIMASYKTDKDMEVAAQLAQRARQIAPLSQDPNRVIYVDTKMSDRARMAQKWEDIGLAAAATACAAMPLGASRFVAQKVCAR